ncbi:SOS response-associated peptidase [Cellulomonas sp. SLBN-39]|uniref:SOS response-associated peptidase n=1 Tax=Cellulomonas sp. SLBN-39 TaxID=2768446 RepID=UPI00114D81D0|nr:SOS response-associated peptidase [Cellulomonas sp. SLBN-39]TQL01291.1 putative SOS response-associated peptidase YedK [Cellulomonas sp. SLBN-39]
MCGRYASFREDQALADEFAVAVVADDVRLLPPSWNVAPTDGVRIVVERADQATGEITRQLRVARWGLVPSWAKDPSVGARMINARVETLAQKSAFARPLATRRALLPADGYYEWQAAPPPATGAKGRTPKQPFFLTPADGSVAALAGLYEFWRDPSKDDDDPARWLVSATVVTRASTGPLAAIHDRRPVLLPHDVHDAWLDPATGADAARAILDVPPPALVATPVSTRVNAVANDGPELLDPVEPAPWAYGGPDA